MHVGTAMYSPYESHHPLMGYGYLCRRYLLDNILQGSDDSTISHVYTQAGDGIFLRESLYHIIHTLTRPDLDGAILRSCIHYISIVTYIKIMSIMMRAFKMRGKVI